MRLAAGLMQSATSKRRLAGLGLENWACSLADMDMNNGHTRQVDERTPEYAQ
jgi:hypothetical protein